MKKPKKCYEYEVKQIGKTDKYKIVRHTYIDDNYHRSNTIYKGLDKGVADDYCYRLENNLPILNIVI